MALARPLEEDPGFRPLTADEVLEMVAAGILDPDERVELLDGRLMRTSPQGAPHQFTSHRIAKRMEGVYADVAFVFSHMTVRGGPHSLPEPDVAVIRGVPEAYAACLPAGRDMILVVDVSQSTRAKDIRKAPIYAREGVPNYWIVDLDRRSLTIYTDPAGDEGYRQMRTLGEDDVVTAPESDASWPVRDLLP